ncbi:oligopeptide transporter 4-like [Phragmites australis]|uniref:oligopeptide transporter 4-like n=1 Tax=Phragmites australis TaxID=29695 RepID=UPI002D76856D|nr:oligopeptide transporter 4-like [Phragmites australis]
MVGAMVLCTVFKEEVQLPWWGLLFACAIAFVLTLPISVITATTNTPGSPIANVCFKVYGYMSMNQSVSFLQDLKLGHYMKIPPRSMSLVQFIGRHGCRVNGEHDSGVVAADDGAAHLREEPPPEGSPWTCSGDHVFFDASVIWGLVGPRRIFGLLGYYNALNWFFLGGLIGPVIVWLLASALPGHAWWIRLVNLPVLLGATGNRGSCLRRRRSTTRRGASWARCSTSSCSGTTRGGGSGTTTCCRRPLVIYFALSMGGDQLDW